ncbi:MAG: GNAT family N-acetyltransferase [Thiohalophilus sp.]|jgi:predicted GNAT family N-acyltransferase
MNPSEVIIEQVSFDDARAAIEPIRRRVFIEEQHVPEELEWDGLDESATHLLARIGQQPVATARLLDNGHIGRMAVLPDWRCQGIGMAMLKQLLSIAQRRRLPAVFLNAQVSAVPFYRKAGFEIEGESFMDAGISHKRMVLQLNVID